MTKVPINRRKIKKQKNMKKDRTRDRKIKIEKGRYWKKNRETKKENMFYLKKMTKRHDHF